VLKAQHQVRHKILEGDLFAPVRPAKQALERLFHLFEDAKLFHRGLLTGWELGIPQFATYSRILPVLFL